MNYRFICALLLVAVLVGTAGATTTNVFALSTNADGRIGVTANVSTYLFSPVWSWGDGTDDSINLTASHLYTKRGVFTLSLNETNQFGFNVTNKTVRVIGE